MVSRKMLLGRGIADHWDGLLRRHRVESKTAPGPVGRRANAVLPRSQGLTPPPVQLRHKEVKLPMSISSSAASAHSDVPTSVGVMP